MPNPDDKPRKSPVDRFRHILSADETQKQKPQQRYEAEETEKAPVMNLPKPRVRVPASQAVHFDHSVPPPSEPEDGSRFGDRGFLPTFWTVASIISLSINVILLLALVVVLRSLGGLNLTGLGTGLLGGLYSNFERMDQAHIQTVIPVQTSIPLNMSIPVQTTTGITLAHDVQIQNAHVRITTDNFNIDSPADVTLPAGTALDVVLNFNVPVQTDVPVTMNVPVDIAVRDTDLHPAITGLEDTIRPLYCMVSPTAQSLSGAPVCR